MRSKIVILLIIVFMLNSAVAFSASTAFEHDYGVGEYLYSLDAAYCTLSDGIQVSGNGVDISAGAEAVYSFFMPFNARSVTVKYSGASGTTVIDSGYREYSLQLSGNGEYVLEFGTHLGYEPQNYYYEGEYSHVVREFTEYSGEREFAVKSSGGITIESMVFEKEKTPVPYVKDTGAKYSFTMPDVSDEVLKTVSTVMLDTKSPVLVVNGGRRYVDNNKIDTVPYNQDGTLYLPINTLAKALGYYCEDIPAKSYVLLRDETHEYILRGGTATIRTGNGTPERVAESAIIYKGGKTWAAVRFFAELAGDTVGYRDGLVVIDDKYTVSEILSDNELYSYATDIFADFKSDEKSGDVYYVAQSAEASDSNDGSITAPFKTLAKAGEVAQAGDVVIIREGVYREVLAPQNSGSAGKPITFRSAEGEKVVISAAEELGAFTHYKDNIYTASMDWDLGAGKNQLFIGEESMMEARYPNNPKWRTEGLSDLWPTRGDFQVPVGDNTVVRSDTLLNQDVDDYWKGGYYVGAFGYDYALATGTIEASTNGEMTIAGTSTKWWWDHKETDFWNYGCIIGHMNALDIEKEWVKQGDTVYFIFPEDTVPDSTKVEAKARQLVIDIADRKYVNIEGIETIGGSVRMNNSEMCMLNGMDMKYITHYTLSNDQRDGYIDWPYNLKNVNGAPQRGEVGIYVGGTDNIIVNCHIDHSAGAGIYGTGLYTYIENNILNDCGYMGSYVSGINFNTVGTDVKNKARGGHAVYNNTVYNCGRSCLNIGQIEGVGHALAPYLPMEIAYNDFHDGMLTTLDTGVIYEYYLNMGLDKKKTEIHHNYIYTTQTKDEENPFAFGIYHDGGSYGTETYNNLVFNTQEDASFTRYPIYQQPAQHAPAYHDVYNNRAFKSGIGEVDSLSSHHFPQEQVFYAGANPYSGGYLVNYTNAANGETYLKYNASNAILSDGVILEDGIAQFTSNEQYICFEDIDFGSGADTVNLTVYGDKNYSCDKIELVIGSSIDEVYPKTYTVQINSPDLNSPDNLNLDVGYITGIQNVYIRMKDYRSLGIGGISVVGLSAKGELESAYSAKIYASDFTSYVAGRNTAPPSAVRYIDGNYTNYYVKDTWGGTVLTYEKMRFRSDAESFVIAAGSNGDNAGQVISVYVDSLNSEPVATYSVDKASWSDFTPVLVPLADTVDAGVHTVYLKFDNVYKTSNVYYFGFLPQGE